MKPKTNTDPMDEAYKMLDGAPSATGVSDAAKGLAPQTAYQENETNQEKKTEQLNGDCACDGQGCSDCQDNNAQDKQANDTPDVTSIQEAYANLFDSLADIMRSSS